MADVDTMPPFDMLRWNAHARPLPLPQQYTPVGGAPLRDFTDEQLMMAPPHLIVHVQRTAAQGGLQVISPRQIPFSQLMVRSVGGKRQIGDHVVGSIANPDDEWPTLDDTDFSELLPDQPLAPLNEEKTVRAKTATAPLTAATHEMSDPILACLVRGRAVVDMLRRDDVQGGADEYLEVLAAAWGIDKEDIEDMDAFTLGIDGPLLRHAIKTDEVYPMCYAPIHIRSCISVGCSEVNRSYLPDDSAMDWRRMRVHAEAVFALTCMIEGHPIGLMACDPPPGNTSAPSDRRNVMCFQPAPATAWCFDAHSFSIVPDRPGPQMRASAIPQDVLAALARHVAVVKPASYALSQGHSLSARKSMTQPVEAPYGETIGAGYMVMVQTLSLGVARGKTAAAAVRNLIYTTIEGANLAVRLRISRYIRIAGEECREHLGMSEVPDRIIQKLANRFLKIGETIRLRVAGEAAQRGHTVEEWWGDIMAQAPERYATFVEGTKGWATVAMWLMFREPTDRWRKLSSAVHYSALREAEVSAVGAMQLPAVKGSPERLLHAVRGAVKGITTAFSGYYKGVADVGLAIAEVAELEGKGRTAEIMREAAYTWVLRARCFRGTNTELAEHDVPLRSKFHKRISAEPRDVLLVPAPYKAYQSYKTHVERSTLLRPGFRKHIASVEVRQVSSVFKEWTEPLVLIKKTVLTRYLNSPQDLHWDMENAWSMLVEDISKVAKAYGEPHDRPPDSPEAQYKKAKFTPSAPIVVNIEPVENPKLDYWRLLAMIDEDEVEWIEDLFARLGQGYEDMFIERDFESLDHFRRLLQDLDREAPQPQDLSGEHVR